MNIELLEKGIKILDDINMSKTRLSTLRKLYSKHQQKSLTTENIEKIFAIATSSVEHVIELKERALGEL